MSGSLKLGVALPSLALSQLSYYLIRNANAYLSENHGVDVVAFFQETSLPCLPMCFGAMQLSEGWGFDGVAIATDLNTARTFLRYPRPAKRFLYVWDLEWLRLRLFSYADLAAVYRHPQLELIVRSDGHKRVVEDAWNRPVRGVVDDFDFEQLVGVIS